MNFNSTLDDELAGDPPKNKSDRRAAELVLTSPSRPSTTTRPTNPFQTIRNESFPNCGCPGEGKRLHSGRSLGLIDSAQTINKRSALKRDGPLFSTTRRLLDELRTDSNSG